VNELHLLADKKLLMRQVITIWAILTLGAILSATLATIFTIIGISSEKSVGISLVFVGFIVVSIHIALYRNGHLPFEVLDIRAQFYPFENLGSQVAKPIDDIRDAHLFVEILNSYSEPEELVKNTLKALFAERVDVPNKNKEINRNYLETLEKIGWVNKTNPSTLETEESALEYRERVRRRYLSLLDELEHRHLKGKTKYPLASEWSQAKDIIEGQQQAEELVGFAFLESIRNLPTRQPRISLLSYVSGVDPIMIASALNIHPTDVPRWHDSGLRFLQEDQELVRKLQTISDDISGGGIAL
jgi:hypothetical protein